MATKIPTPQQVPIVFEFNVDQIQLIMSGLSELPHKNVAGLYEHIRSVTLVQLEDAKQKALKQIEQPGIEGAQG